MVKAPDYDLPLWSNQECVEDEYPLLLNILSHSRIAGSNPAKITRFFG